MSTMRTNGPNSPIYANGGDVITHIAKRDIINPFNLKKVILFLEAEITDEERVLSSLLDLPEDDDLIRIDINKKNELNLLESEGRTYYFETIIDSSMYFTTIRDMLAEPRNADLKKAYNNIKKTIQGKVAILRQNQDYFCGILDEIINRFINSDDECVLENEGMVTIIIHFMYYICHIGEH